MIRLLETPLSTSKEMLYLELENTEFLQYIQQEEGSPLIQTLRNSLKSNGLFLTLKISQVEASETLSGSKQHEKQWNIEKKSKGNRQR